MASGFHWAFFICLTSRVLISGTMSATDGPDNPGSGCPPGWTQFGSRCFIFHFTPKTWTDAEHTCIAAGGNLASIHNAEENVFLKNVVERVTGRASHTWIGGFDAVTEGKWMWTDGSKFDYARWSLREPNNLGTEHCIEMNWGGSYWNDSKCRHRRHFICAKDIPPCAAMSAPIIN
ncbi:galactose-specific lectin nattectin-like isoform X2 [Enoplosus armatus]|uniref:galactose-specific lectin nattectin-like isoform X2 n=1 Tax=Enoplosus armatus TaxID=215367 RepID=UPI0039944252